MKNFTGLYLFTAILIASSGSVIAGSKTVGLTDVSTMQVYWDSPDSGGDLKIKVYDSGCGDRSRGSEYITRYNPAVFEFSPYSKEQTLTYNGRSFDCIDLNNGDRNDDITVSYEPSRQVWHGIFGWRTKPSKWRLEYAPGGVDNKDLIYIESNDFNNAKLSCVYDRDGVDGTDDKYIYPLLDGDILKLMISETKASFC
ncbi:hypothetical protein [Vibrio coralliilyticus]|uniref:hypothetical protein n=1 Tax=Vibrio coralliilyticus TaxID=190893 RepID=UPI001E4F3B71|nr:hypothetical protein [Vibrio coralliilyticus]MCC2525565.1 hypothetical protein [Vibrio coralliilyticus]